MVRSAKSSMAATGYWLLRAYDINYYLTYHPPQALLAAAIIAALATFMGLILLSRLTGWAVSAATHRGPRPSTR